MRPAAGYQRYLRLRAVAPRTGRNRTSARRPSLDRVISSESGSHRARSARSPLACTNCSLDGVRPAQPAGRQPDPGQRVRLDHVRRRTTGVPWALDRLHRRVRRDPQLQRAARRPLGEHVGERLADHRARRGPARPAPAPAASGTGRRRARPARSPGSPGSRPGRSRRGRRAPPGRSAARRRRPRRVPRRRPRAPRPGSDRRRRRRSRSRISVGGRGVAGDVARRSRPACRRWSGAASPGWTAAPPRRARPAPAPSTRAARTAAARPTAAARTARPRARRPGPPARSAPAPGPPAALPPPHRTGAAQSNRRGAGCALVRLAQLGERDGQDAVDGERGVRRDLAEAGQRDAVLGGERRPAGRRRRPPP